MRDALLIQHAYPGRGFEKMIELTREHNQAYCDKHGFDFQCVVEDNLIAVDNGAWAKIKYIKEALREGYQYIVWLDADAMIIDTSVDLREAVQYKKISACWHRIPQLNHWNVGVLYIYNSPNVVDFVDKWFNSYPPPADGWFEQGVFNRLALKNNTVITASDRWNATIDVSMVPDAVVMGFHGQGDAEYRYKLIQEVFESAIKKAHNATLAKE